MCAKFMRTLKENSVNAAFKLTLNIFLTPVVPNFAKCSSGLRLTMLRESFRLVNTLISNIDGEALMMDLKQIRDHLIDRRVDIVASETGLGYTTVREIRNGKQDNPRYNTIKALSDYFEEKKDV